MLNAIVFAGDMTSFIMNYVDNLRYAAWAAGATFFFYARRQYALRQAARFILMDKAMYDVQWAELRRERGFDDQLEQLWRTWQYAMASGETCGKRQRAKCSSIEELFTEADRLNDLFQRKFFDVCSRHRGIYHRADVKAEGRALQKVFRSYGSDWRKLTDLVRGSLEFRRLSDVNACLRALADDPQVKILKVNDSKMRLRNFPDDRAVGYRDIQLSVLLETPESRARKTHKHICEVQLHLDSIYALKSDKGHMIYVTSRNMRGE